VAVQGEESMKHYELARIAEHLSDFNFITRARRIENDTIEISFNKEESYFFNMTRGESFVYKKSSKRPLQSFNAPFDNLLHSLVSSAKVEQIEVPKNERIIRFHLTPKNAYKEQKIALQFEFTGRHTNAILIDDNEVTIEALRHIDAHASFRVIRPGVELLAIPSFNGKIEEEEHLDDIETYLQNKYLDFEKKRIQNLKKQKLLSVKKKQDKLKQLLKKLPNPEKLSIEMKKYQNYGNIILANLYQIKAYDKSLKTYDFEGNEISIKLPKGIVPNRMSEYFFNQAKRAKAKSKNIHIEEENLRTKLKFYDNMYHAIEQAQSSSELELLLPKKAKSQRKKERLKEGELFWIEDYKVLIGRNSKENQALLKIAKSNDLWMHIRDIPSSHLIIKTDKQNLPEGVIQKAAKLCVDFSLTQAGDYEVDYCKRRFVKIQEGSNVEYDKYQTIRVRKEGIEIRE